VSRLLEDEFALTCSLALHRSFSPSLAEPDAVLPPTGVPAGKCTRVGNIQDGPIDLIDPSRSDEPGSTLSSGANPVCVPER
jgi:hypothetical protein